MISARLYEKIIAEKPDGFKKIPNNILSLPRIEELKKIPRLVVGIIAGTDSMAALHESLKRFKVDAVILVSAYTGTGYGERRSLWKTLQTYKRAIEKTYNVYCTEPLVIGAPEFWWALNGRFMQELLVRFKFYCPCFGCRLYLYALQVPLCRELNISTVISGSSIRNEDRNPPQQTNTVNHYSANLLSSFGIKLIYNIVGNNADTELNNSLTNDAINGQDDCYPCVFGKNYQLLNGMWKEPSTLNQYFEQFLIPAAAKIISKVLAHRDFEYNNEVIDVLMPGTKKIKGKRK
jgi:hypothetical protein